MEETRKTGRGQRKAAVKPASKSPGNKTSSGAAVGRATPIKASPKRAPRPQQQRSNDGVIREEWIRVAAYYRAERRGFAPGYDLEDWFAAEAGLAPPVRAARPNRTRKANLSG